MTMCLKAGYVSHVKNESEIPKEKHWAILTFESISISTGYEKAGEYGSSDTVTRYHVYKDEVSWRDALQQLATKSMEQKFGRENPYVGLVVAGRAYISINVGVEIQK